MALRPATAFPPVRGSVFDDPGDEKSWHISQRSENLSRFYATREPSWYDSAIAPLKGAERVLDLGCGPGLALEALLGQGCPSVLGVDRWPVFAANSTPAAPIVAHDLSLPMPFLESGSFDGVLSHYALDYVSPICTRQVLREAHRLLAPGGRLVIYVAAIGLGGGDESRTVCYSPTALRALLDEAGFERVEVDASSNGRNSVARARRGAQAPRTDTAGRGEAETAIEGDTQLSAAFVGAGETLECELTGPEGSAVFALGLPSIRPHEKTRVSVCARVLGPTSGAAELQLWAWRGHAVSAAERIRFESPATRLGFSCAGGEVEHISAWSPGELPLEPPGNAHARFCDLPRGSDLNDAQRGAEGRQVVVESAGDAPADLANWIGPASNRFPIRRASRVDLSTIDREWLAGHVYGIACTTDDLEGEKMRELLLWAGWRQALVYLRGLSWKTVLGTALRREDELRGPVVLVDPALSSEAEGTDAPPEIAAFAGARNRFFVLLGPAARDRLTPGTPKGLRGRFLHGGLSSEGDETTAEASEVLRQLTERTMLMRLRQAKGHTWAEVGRRPV